jgi:uncharacterized protein YjeT (DUF2065 family)
VQFSLRRSAGSSVVRGPDENLLMTILLTAFALMLVIEGVLPFLMPGLWRQTFRKLTEMSDGQIRFIGLTSMLPGLLLLYIVRH